MEVHMGWLSRFFESKDTLKVDNPAAIFEKPSDVVKDRKLSQDEIRKALNTWEQDARQLMTASNEGMPGPEEGVATEVAMVSALAPGNLALTRTVGTSTCGTPAIGNAK
jgi:hypothetical protein